jgi:dihydroxyacetone kinase-like predicted kinase
MAHGALMGAGQLASSSQILSGIADRLSEKKRFSGSDFAEALEVASQKATRP